jgi:hypothetical protein
LSALTLLPDLEPAPAADQAVTWKPIPEWPTHETSTDGRVRRIPWLDAQGCLHLGGELAQSPDKRKGKGYLYATLRDGDRRRKAHVAVLVLEAHRELKPGPEYEACHGNGIRTDNRLCNLRWDTKEANLAQMWEERRERHQDAGSVAGGVFAQDGACRSAALQRHGRAAAHGTGSPPIPHLFPSQSASVQPSPSTVGSPFRALRSLLRAA